MVANGSEEYETVYDYTVNGKYTALLQKEIKTVKETSSAVTSNNGLAISPTDLITSTTTNAKREETAYSYDANGNQITKITADKTETNTYDSLNQLIGFTDGKTTASYKYDVDGLRISKTVDGHSIDQIWNDDKQIAVDADGSNPYKAQIYIRGTNLLAGCEFVQAVKSDYTYYTQNAHGDVVNLTDNNSAVTKTYQYDAFGVEKNIDDADTNAFRYCGEYYDKETATIYLRARYYNPSNGRFISRDSFAGSNNDPLSLNLYTYCHNNPVSGTDSTGHFLDTLLDIASLAYDIYSFAKDPTPSGALDVALDIVGLAAPGIPSAGLKAGAHLAGAAYKAAGATHGLSKAVGVVAAVSKNGDTALKLTDTVKDAKKASNIVNSSTQGLQDAFRYGSRRKHRNTIGQAHHIGQNAAFRDVIPGKEGLAVRLRGNVFKEVGSPHYNAHSTLENFWNDYRRKGKFAGTKPTVAQYNRAAYTSLINAGISENQAAHYIRQVYTQQRQYGLNHNSLVYRVPRACIYEEKRSRNMKRKFGFFDIFRKNDAEIQYQFAMQNLQNGAYEEAVRLLLLSANQGFPLAQLELADCYADGYGVAINPIEAFSWYYKAACSGNPDAQYEVAVCYEQGNGIDRNLQKAVEWYQKAAEQGIAESQYNLAQCYANGLGVKQDAEKAVFWYQKAAAQGNSYAQFNLGSCYLQGIGVPINKSVAKKYFEAAKRNGHERADEILKEYF